MNDLEEEFFGKEGGAPDGDMGKIVSERAEIISLLNFSYLLMVLTIEY